MENLDKDMKHIPIMVTEILDQLIPQTGTCRIIDGTLGYGGHSSAMLKRNPEAQLMGIDRDNEALAHSEEVLSFAKARVNLKRGSYSEMKELANSIGWEKVDAILLDIGISSPQIDDPARGFAHRFEGPLDMRMDRRSTLTASRVVNRYPEDKLISLFREYGEIKSARKLAAAIVERREEMPFSTTSDMRELCEELFGKARPGQLPTATLCFQALRIEVNKELDELKNVLKDALDLLNPGGRLGIISFHSLEDRIVKNEFRVAAQDCVCPPGLPVCICDHKATVKVITKKPLTACKEEVEFNSRSNCAKLRIAEKL